MSRKTPKNDGTKKETRRGRLSKEAVKRANATPPMTTEREAEIKEKVSGALGSAEKQTITAAEVGTLTADELLGSAETSSEAQKVVDQKPSPTVDSPSSRPDASAKTATAEPAIVSQAKGFQMNLTLTKGATSKSGKKVAFTNPALIRSIVLPVGIFATVPDSLSLSGDGFKTRSAEEQAKAESRNAKRAEKGLKPKLTPQERATQLAARSAKLKAKLERAQAAAAKLAAKLGTAAPGAATSEAASAQ